MALLANTYKGKGDLPARPQDFMPYYDPLPIDNETLRERLKSLF